MWRRGQGGGERSLGSLNPVSPAQGSRTPSLQESLPQQVAVARRGPRQVRGGGAVARMSSGDSGKVSFCATRTLLGTGMKLRGATQDTQHSKKSEHTDNRQHTEHTRHQHSMHTHIACSTHTAYSTT